MDLNLNSDQVESFLSQKQKKLTGYKTSEDVVVKQSRTENYMKNFLEDIHENNGTLIHLN